MIKGKIVIEKKTRSIYLKDDPNKLVKYYFRTENEARQAIEKILPKAIEHFNEYLKAYREITNKLNFSKGFNYDGDTYGIYNEYDYISFKMNDLQFQFEIKE